jgi:single-stranded DNA-binding protein
MKGIACAFEGRLARDAQLKTTSAGRDFMVFSVITGEEADEQWLNVSAWNDHLIEMAGHLKAGVAVYVEGKLKMRHWDSEQGPRSGLQVSASLVQPLALIGRSKPKAPRAAKKANGKVDSQKPIETPFNDALPF